MYILGIHGSFGKANHDPAAVLIQNNKIIAAAEEERFVRYKHGIGLMPDYAIKFCLQEAKITMKEIDIIAFPNDTWFDFQPRLKSYLWYNFGYVPKIEYVDHHTSHAASSYLISGFPSALIITLDLSGDGISCGIFRGNGNKIQVIEKIPFPNSIGLFAAFITQYLGFRSNHDEYKVMGLSAYGKPNIDLSKILSFNNGELKFNTNFLHKEVLNRHPIFHTAQLPMFKDLSYSFLPNRRLKGMRITKEHENLAASAQKVIEDSILTLIKKYKSKEDKYLCLGGGVAENSVSNGKLAESGLFEDIYIPPACSDAGGALGSALYVANKEGYKFERITDNKWGTYYSDQYIKNSLDKYGLKYKYSKNIPSLVAKLLADEKIVGWYQGKMEFGSRALGSRSIVANPSIKKMKLRVNRIKKREEFRPFAPSVLNEFHTTLFNKEQFSPFMSFTLNTTPLGKKLIVAATHVDTTARLQSIGNDKSLYRNLIEEFYKYTKVPAILNTSFNSSWEPIVENPEQAIAFFYSSELEALAIGNYLVKK